MEFFEGVHHLPRESHRDSLTDGVITPRASRLGGLRSPQVLQFQVHRSGRRSEPGRQIRSMIIRRGSFHGQASPRRGSGSEGALPFNAVRLLGHSVALRFLRIRNCNTIGFA